MANIVEDEVIKAEMQDGISQVDNNLIITEFSTAYDSANRKLRVSFVAVNKETSEKITINEALR